MPPRRRRPAMSVAPARRDVAVLTGRNLVHIAREPLQLSDVTIQPVLFTLLFVYVFGAGVVLPHGGSYTDFAIAGLLALNLTTSAMGTAVGLSTDLSSGVIDRFRTLPMWRAGRARRPLARRPPHGDALRGDRRRSPASPIGWRPGGRHRCRCSPASAVFLLFSYALSWVLRLPRDRQQGAGVGAGGRA